MRSKLWRIVLAIFVLVLTISVFVYYFVTNSSIRQQLSNTSLFTIVLLLVLYMCTIGALMLITAATLRLCGIKITLRENMLLNAYTTVINFFGPLQSGPAFRAVYLKKTHKLSLKKYATATLVYYFFFALISGAFLMSGVLKWWLVPIVLVIGLTLYLIRKSSVVTSRFSGIDFNNWYFLAAATLLQLSLVATIYFVELHTLSPRVSVSQAIIYTGAADFALFVSITPGAIGFREAFLVFSRRLHHISSALIISANILDRVMYLLLLIFLALFIVVVHAKRQLSTEESQDEEATAKFQ